MTRKASPPAEPRSRRKCSAASPTPPLHRPHRPADPHGAATLEWTVPTTQTNGATLADLAGYRIHYGKSVGVARPDDRDPQSERLAAYVIEGLAPGTYYFAVTAFNSRNHESERSNAGEESTSLLSRQAKA